MLLYPKKFQTKWSFIPGISKTCVTPLGNSNAYIQDSWKFHDQFLFLAAPGISIFHSEIPWAFFSEIAHSHSYTDSYVSSFWWVVNILLQKFYTLKKEILTQKAASLSLLWTRPIDLWCNMVETLEIQKNIGDKTLSVEHSCFKYFQEIMQQPKEHEKVIFHLLFRKPNYV